MIIPTGTGGSETLDATKKVDGYLHAVSWVQSNGAKGGNPDRGSRMFY